MHHINERCEQKNPGCRVQGNSLQNPHNFSIYLQLFQNKHFIYLKRSYRHKPFYLTHNSFPQSTQPIHILQLFLNFPIIISNSYVQLTSIYRWRNSTATNPRILSNHIKQGHFPYPRQLSTPWCFADVSTACSMNPKCRLRDIVSFHLTVTTKFYMLLVQYCIVLYLNHCMV